MGLTKQVMRHRSLIPRRIYTQTSASLYNKHSGSGCAAVATWQWLPDSKAKTVAVAVAVVH
jgi:hypothetical protein